MAFGEAARSCRRGAGLVAALLLLAAGGAAAEGGQPGRAAPRATLTLEHAFGAGAWAAAGTLELKVRPQLLPAVAALLHAPPPGGGGQDAAAGPDFPALNLRPPPPRSPRGGPPKPRGGWTGDGPPRRGLTRGRRRRLAQVPREADHAKRGRATVVRLERAEWGGAEQEEFRRLVAEDGFYRIRVPAQPLAPGEGGHLVAAVKARCLASSQFTEQIVLHPDMAGNLVSLEYNTPSRACRATPPASFAFNPKSQAVVKTPKVAPQLSGAGGGKDVPVAGAVKMDGAMGGDGAMTGPDGKPLPKKDERPWYQKVRLHARRWRRQGRRTDSDQKNWMFLMAITMLVLNILTPEPPKQQGGQQVGQRRR